MGKGKLHAIFVGVGDRDHSIASRHWTSHPLTFLDDLPVGLKETVPDLGQVFATPVCASYDQFAMRCDGLIGSYFIPPILLSFMPAASLPGLVWPISWK